MLIPKIEVPMLRAHFLVTWYLYQSVSVRFLTPGVIPEAYSTCVYNEFSDNIRLILAIFKFEKVKFLQKFSREMLQNAYINTFGGLILAIFNFKKVKFLQKNFEGNTAKCLYTHIWRPDSCYIQIRESQILAKIFEGNAVKCLYTHSGCLILAIFKFEKVKFLLKISREMLQNDNIYATYTRVRWPRSEYLGLFWC